MNTHHLSSALAWLGDATLQATILIAFAWFSSLSVWKLSAAKRHTLLVLALCSVPLLMVGALRSPQWSWTSSSAQPAPSTWQTRVTLASSDEPPQPATSQAVATATIQTSSAGVNAMMLIWFTGVALTLGKLGLSMLRLRSIRRRSTSVSDGRVQSLIIHHPSVEVLVSSAAIMPMTWGVIRPVIVLPPSFAAWSDERLRLVIEHELAHIERRDALAHLACSLAACCLWFHPFVWIVQRRLAQLRESACDDHVLRHSEQSPADYADELIQAITALRKEGHALALAPALAIGMASMAARELKARLTAILDTKHDRSTLSVRGRWLSALGCTTLASLLSSLSACREAPKATASGHRVATDDSRIYFLSDTQFNRLIGAAPPAPTPAPVDPFAPKIQASLIPSKTSDLVQLAMRIRTRLLDEGIAFQPNQNGEALVMADERAMKVWADDANHTKITTLINRGGPTTKQVRMSMFAFEVPVTPEHLKHFVEESSSPRLEMRGVLTEDQGKALLLKLREDKEIKLMATPTTTAKSGERSSIEVVREFLYPTEFDPPNVPEPDKITGKAGPVTPATPTAFEMRPVGLRMETEAVVGQDGSIDLQLAPELTSFEGFINYGSPIKERNESNAGSRVELTLTENRIPQPVFSTSKIRTNVTIADGSYVILGGSANEPAITLDPISKTAQNQNDVDVRKLPTWGNSKTAIFFLIQASIVKNDRK